MMLSFLLNLKDIIKSSRRMVRGKYFLALNSRQRANLRNTCDEAIKAIKEVKNESSKDL